MTLQTLSALSGEPQPTHSTPNSNAVIKLSQNPRANHRIINAMISGIHATADEADALTQKIFKTAGIGP